MIIKGSSVEYSVGTGNAKSITKKKSSTIEKARKKKGKKSSGVASPLHSPLYSFCIFPKRKIHSERGNEKVFR